MTSETTLTATRMHADDYHAAPGLSNSALKDLEVSPLRYWHLHINPNRPVDEPTPAMKIGTALHCALLEPTKFDSRFACSIQREDHWLVTVEDIRTWLKDHSQTPKGTKKDGLITQALDHDPKVMIFDVEEKVYAAANEGKTILHPDDWARVHGMAAALRNEEALAQILEAGEPEVSMFAPDPETGVLLKSRMDWVTPAKTLDVKTFSQMRGKSIDKSVADAIYYEKYYRTAYFYTQIRVLQESAPPKRPDFVLAFVESEEPFEVRLRVLRPTTAGQPNLYWMRAQQEVTYLIRRYSDYVTQYGLDPWRDEQRIDPLLDDEIPQMSYGI